MNELRVSSDFTIEDIHAIRERNYEMRKTMTAEEIEKKKKDSLEWFNSEMLKRNLKDKAM